MTTHRRPVAVFCCLRRRHRPSNRRGKRLRRRYKKAPILCPQLNFPSSSQQRPPNPTPPHLGSQPPTAALPSQPTPNLDLPAKMLPTLVFTMLAAKAMYNRKSAKTALKMATLSALTLGLVLTLSPTTTLALPTPVLQLSDQDHGHHEPPPHGSHATLAPTTLALPTPPLQLSDHPHDPNEPPGSHGMNTISQQLVPREVRQSQANVNP